MSSELIILSNALFSLGVAPDFDGLEEGPSEHRDVTPEGEYEEWVPFTQTGLAVDEEPNALDSEPFPSSAPSIRTDRLSANVLGGMGTLRLASKTTQDLASA